MGEITSHAAALLAECKSAEPITQAEARVKLLSRSERDDRVGRHDGAPKVFRSSFDLVPPAAHMPDAEQLKRMVASRGMPWHDAYAQRAVPYIASDERVDHHGDIVLQSWKFDVFASNSPAPFDHDWHGLPVARHVDWGVSAHTAKDYSGPVLRLLAVFPTEDVSEWGDSVFRLVKAGFMPGISVGFVPGVVHDVKDVKEREKLGLGQFGFVLGDNMLLEASPTMLPANHGALALLSKAARAKTIQPYDVHVLRELERQAVRGKTEERERWLRAENRLLQTARTLWPDEPWQLHRELDVPVTLAERPHRHASARNTNIPDDTRKLLEQAVASINELSTQCGVVLNDLRERVESLADSASGSAQSQPQNGSSHHDDGGANSEEQAVSVSPEMSERLSRALAALDGSADKGVTAGGSR